MKVSVITWDANFREHTHTIDFFARQEFPQDDFEFIWVDFYNSNNQVRQKIESYPNTRLVKLGNSHSASWHLGRCINAGVEASSGQLLVIPDGDIVVEPDFLSYVWRAHQKYQDLALYFRRYDEPQQASSNQRRISISYLQQHATLCVATNYAGCLTLRRENFECIRGYETHPAFAGPGINGMETYTRLRNVGIAIKWSPDKKIYHPWHPNAGSAGHDDTKALWLARHKYPWIIPYAGLQQSWIVHCRELSGDIIADETKCDEYLAHMPQVDMDYYRRLSQLITSPKFVYGQIQRDQTSSTVFIIGVPRSGTTLLRAMLDSHPNLAVGPECPWIGGSYGNLTSFKDLYHSLVADRRGPVQNFEGVSEEHVTRALGNTIASILQAYAIARGKKRWVEKTPNHIAEIPFIVKLFPQSKFIHIIRDGRDVACSSFKERVTWGPNLVHGEERIPNTRLNALQRWCRWVSQFEKWKQRYNLDVCQIYYEDLVQNPCQVLKKVLDFIGEPWSDNVLKYKRHKHDMPDWEAGSRDVAQKSDISAESIGRWKREFTPMERSIAASFADHMLLKLGYEATSPLKSNKKGMKCAHIHLIHTYYPHFGQYSGIHQFIRYVNSANFQMDVQVVPMGDTNCQISDVGLRRRLQHLVRMNGVRAYDLNDLLSEFTAFRQWLNGRIDLLHYLDGEHSLQYLPFLFRKFGQLKARPPIVATFHQPPDQLDLLLNIEIVRLLDHVVVLSPEQVSYFEQFVPTSKISLILHGVDIDYFQPRSGQKEKGKFKCISVGSWLRDYDKVLVVAEMLQSHPDIEFYIVSSTVSTKHHPKNVHVYSGIDDTTLLKMYQQADVLFLPLLGATANNVLLEGLACGLPVVSSDLSAVKAYMPGKEAILIPKNDPELFKNALLKLYQDSNLCREMASHARQRAIELSWPNIADKFEEIYSKLIACKTSR